ncbi:hypothetical protein PMIN04_002443 [Paraphaeosphaeria minitans]
MSAVASAFRGRTTYKKNIVPASDEGGLVNNPRATPHRRLPPPRRRASNSISSEHDSDAAPDPAENTLLRRQFNDQQTISSRMRCGGGSSGRTISHAMLMDRSKP